MTAIPRFGLGDEVGFARWLVQQPRALVLYRGVGCEYSSSFENVFLDVSVEGRACAVRDVEEGGEGPVAEALGVDLTPTVGAFTKGIEERLEAKMDVGITRERYLTWLDEI